jgi:hypothetical protein
MLYPHLRVGGYDHRTEEREPMKDNAPAKPELDPELLAMEAQAGGMITSDQYHRLEAIAGPGKRSASAGPEAKTKNRTRRGRRALARRDARPDLVNRSHARLGRAKPVKSKMQMEIEFRAAVREQLSGIKLSKVLRECAELRYVAGTPGLGNVWQLSRASTATIQGIPGLGAVRRQKIKAWLQSRNVPVSWEA